MFWEIIATARERTRPGIPFSQALTGCLADLPPPDIQRYQQRFDLMRTALYRRDVWAAAYLIEGGCSDDAFTDFRAGIIGQGQHWYDAVTESPDNLASH